MTKDYFDTDFKWLASVAVNVIGGPRTVSTGRAGVTGGRRGGSASCRPPRPLLRAIVACGFKLSVDGECSRLETLHAFFLAFCFLERLSSARRLPKIR